MAYTYAHAIDDGQDALVARPARHRANCVLPPTPNPAPALPIRAIACPSPRRPTHPFHREHPLLGKIFNDSKLSSVITIGSGRTVDARIFSDPNQTATTATIGSPVTAATPSRAQLPAADMRLARKLFIHNRMKLDLCVINLSIFSTATTSCQPSVTITTRTPAGYFTYIDSALE